MRSLGVALLALAVVSAAACTGSLPGGGCTNAGGRCVTSASPTGGTCPGGAVPLTGNNDCPGINSLCCPGADAGADR